MQDYRSILDLTTSIPNVKLFMRKFFHQPLLSSISDQNILPNTLNTCICFKIKDEISSLNNKIIHEYQMNCQIVEK